MMIQVASRLRLSTATVAQIDYRSRGIEGKIFER